MPPGRTLLFALLLPTMPFWLLPLHCKGGQLYVMIMQLYGPAILLYTAVKCIIVVVKLKAAARVPSWKALYPPSSQDPRAAKIRHLVLMRGYKEPLELMFSTLNSLRNQTVVKDLIVVVGLEEGSPADYDAAFHAEYDGVFAELLVTRHPRNWAPMERPGSCSNSNYAWRQIVQRLHDRGELDRKCMICTSCDTDTVFPPNYFEYVGLAFLRHRNPLNTIWQAPLFYNLQLDERPFFVRATGIMRTAFMCGFLIGQSLNPMSTFSYSVDLLIRCDFIHPFHVMDDVVHILTCMKAVRDYVPVELIPLVVVSGPTSGDSLWEEVYEWGRQVRRWCIGTMAVYHYFVSKQLKGNFRFWPGLRYHLLFTHYYGFMLCSLLMTGLLGEIATVIYRRSSLEGHDSYCGAENGYSKTLVDWVAAGSLIGAYAAFVVFFAMDRVGVRLGTAAGIVDENMPLWRNVLHFIGTWPTLLAYNLVQIWSSIEGSLRGQRVVSLRGGGGLSSFLSAHHPNHQSVKTDLARGGKEVRCGGRSEAGGRYGNAFHVLVGVAQHKHTNCRDSIAPGTQMSVKQTSTDGRDLGMDELAPASTDEYVLME